MKMDQEYTWNIVDKKEEAPGVYSLFLKAKNERPSFKAGQYLTVRLPEQVPTEGKAYSIASIPEEDIFRITIRNIGIFSRALTSLSVGDTLTTSAPYGFFYPEPEDINDLVFIVGGIGITPCFSIIKRLCNSKDKRNIHLLYSNQTESDMVFFSELSALTKEHNTFSTTHFITREEPKTAGYQHGRMTPERILETLPNIETSEFFICGSMNFSRDIWKGLREAGVKQTQLYTEGFF